MSVLPPSSLQQFSHRKSLDERSDIRHQGIYFCNNRRQTSRHRLARLLVLLGGCPIPRYHMAAKASEFYRTCTKIIVRLFSSVAPIPTHIQLRDISYDRRS